MTLARKFGFLALSFSLYGNALTLARGQETSPPGTSAAQQPEVPAVPLPQGEPQEPAPESPANPSEAQPQPQEKPAETAPSTTKKKKKKRRKKSAEAPGPTEGPIKTVVRNGSTPEPEVKFSSGATGDQENKQRGKVNYLLSSTNDNLKKISSKQLNAAQQDAVKQIRTYMEQAKSALDDGDLQRGENLAAKARILSDDLVKH